MNTQVFGSSRPIGLYFQSLTRLSRKQANLTSLASLVRLGKNLPKNRKLSYKTWKTSKIMPYLVRLVEKIISAEYFEGASGGPSES